jgi:hypothetical protein
VQRCIAKVASFIDLDAGAMSAFAAAISPHLATQWSALSPSLLVAFTSEKSASAKSAVSLNRENMVSSGLFTSQEYR